MGRESFITVSTAVEMRLRAASSVGTDNCNKHVITPFKFGSARSASAVDRAELAGPSICNAIRSHHSVGCVQPLKALGHKKEAPAQPLDRWKLNKQNSH